MNNQIGQNQIKKEERERERIRKVGTGPNDKCSKSSNPTSSQKYQHVHTPQIARGPFVTNYAMILLNSLEKKDKTKLNKHIQIGLGPDWASNSFATELNSFRPELNSLKQL